MSRSRHTLITVGAAAATIVVAYALGIRGSTALLLGAMAGFITSIVYQRRMASRPAAGIASDDPADLKAISQAAASAVLQVREAGSLIQDRQARELVERIGESLSGILAAAGDRSGSAVALVFDQLIEPVQALLTEYSWLERRGDQASRDAMDRITTRDLPAAEVAARQALAIFQRSSPPDLDALRRTVDFAFSFGGQAVSPSPEMWGNRQRLVDEAERERGH